MSDDDRPRLGGYILPEAKNVLIATVVGSIAGYFIWGRAHANLIAIFGAIVLTVVLVVREQHNQRSE